MYANVSDEQYHQLVTALHQQWRVATRAVMILLSASGMSAADIAVLLHYDPATVRRWIARHDLEGLDGLPDRPRPGRPRIGSPGIGERIRALLTTPKAWTTARIYQQLGRPAMSLRTCCRRIREQAVWRRPRLIAKGDPDHDTICADIRQQIGALPAGSVDALDDRRDRTVHPTRRLVALQCDRGAAAPPPRLEQRVRGQRKRSGPARHLGHDRGDQDALDPHPDAVGRFHDGLAQLGRAHPTCQ
nr:helix-turn-helix domain-containing protein [Actinoplanes sp. ATCC 53533]